MSLRLIVTDGEQIVPDNEQLMAASFIALGESILKGAIKIEQAIVIAVIDGGTTYTPIGQINLVEATGLLELASRKIERDMLNR